MSAFEIWVSNIDKRMNKEQSSLFHFFFIRYSNIILSIWNFSPLFQWEWRQSAIIVLRNPKFVPFSFFSPRKSWWFCWIDMCLYCSFHVQQTFPVRNTKKMAVFSFIMSWMDCRSNLLFFQFLIVKVD